MTETTSNDSNWFVYIVEAANGKLYTGIATDVERRFREHRGGKKGARFFRTTTPVRIVWREAYPDRSSATKREMAIKKMTRQKKLALLTG
jgi:putative endonuclease